MWVLVLYSSTLVRSLFRCIFSHMLGEIPSYQSTMTHFFFSFVCIHKFISSRTIKALSSNNKRFTPVGNVQVELMGEILIGESTGKPRCQPAGLLPARPRSHGPTRRAFRKNLWWVLTSFSHKFWLRWCEFEHRCVEFLCPFCLYRNSSVHASIYLEYL